MAYPIGLRLAAHTWDFYNDIAYKYVKLAEILGISYHEAVLQGMTSILKNTSFRFLRMVRKARVEEEVDFENIHKKFQVMAQVALEDTRVEINSEFITIGRRVIYFDDTSYRRMFPEMDYLIEYTALCLIKQRSQMIYKRIMSYKDPNKENFTIDEAESFTGYKKSYLYKAKSLGMLKAGQAKPGAKLFFKRKDLEAFMYRNESKSVEDFL